MSLMNSMSRRSSLLALAATVLVAQDASAGVIVVGGGGQFSDLQMAVDAAANGDTVLVKGGAYSSVVIDGKALSIVAEAAQTVTVYGSVAVRNLAAAQTVVISRLVVKGSTVMTGIMPGIGLLLEANAGHVRVQSSAFEGAQGWGDGTCGGSCDCCNLQGHHWGWDGVAATGNAGGIAFVDCFMKGGRGAHAYNYCYCGAGGVGGDGLRITDSLVALYDCVLQGGKGGNNGYAGGTGGAGCRTVFTASATAVHASGSILQGGLGGEGYDWAASVGGAGGHGLLVGSGTFAWWLESTAQGGPGGPACGGSLGYGPNGSTTTGPGSVFPFAMPRLKLSAPGVVREGTSYPLTVQGRPGDQVYLFVARKTQFALVPSWHGAFLAQYVQPSPVMILGAIPASGVLTTGLDATALGAGVQAETVFLQAWRNSPIDGLTLGSFAAVTVLDSAY